MEIILIGIAIYQMIFVLFFIDAQKFLGRILFKVIPFLSALFMVVYAAVQKGCVTF